MATAPEEVVSVMLDMEQGKLSMKTIDEKLKRDRKLLENALIAHDEVRFELDDGQDEILVGKRFKQGDKISYSVKDLNALLPKNVMRSILTIGIDVKKLESLVDTGVITAEELAGCMDSVKDGSWTVMVDRQKREA